MYIFICLFEQKISICNEILWFFSTTDGNVVSVFASLSSTDNGNIFYVDYDRLSYIVNGDDC